MKNFHFLLVIFFFYNLNIQAQYTDDMETCVTDGDPPPIGHWTNMGCDGGSGCDIVCSSVRSRSGDWSGLIPNDGTTQAVLDLGNKIFGGWAIEFWLFIPSGNEAYFNLQQFVPIGEGEPFAHTYFNQGLNNPGVGVIEDTALGAIPFSFPHDEWFRVVMNWDISTGVSLATWELFIDEEFVIFAGTPYTNYNGEHAISLGGIEFSSVSDDTILFIDDIQYNDDIIICFPTEDTFRDTMEYESNEPLEDWWTCEPNSCDLISTAQAHNGTRSGLITDDGSTAVNLDLGGQIYGTWGLEFWQYIPSNKEGYWNLQGQVPFGDGDRIVGNIFFNKDTLNPGIGLIDDCAFGEVNFSFPHDQWFKVMMNIDISSGINSSTWQFVVDGNVVIPEGTPFTNSSGDYPSRLGGIYFSSISSENMMYIDDFNYVDRILSVNDFPTLEVVIYPNPAKNIINISSQEPIKSISIYNSLGNIVAEALGETTIDVSNLTSGLYFIEVTTGGSKSVEKFIKK